MDLSRYFTLADISGIAPEIVLTIAALSVLTVEMMRVSRPGINLMVAAAGLLVAGVFAAQGFKEEILFGGMLRLNKISLFFDFLYLAVAFGTLILSQGYLEKKGGKPRGEYHALILFCVIGMMLMTEANDLVIVFLGLELLSLSLYILVGFLRHDVLSNESGLKYLFLGAFSTGFFLFGAALIYGAAGTTNYNEIASVVASGEILSYLYLSLGIGLLLIGFAFKVALVPFHLWSPDVYQGAPTTVTAFLCTAPKAAGFGALLNIFIVAFPEIQIEWQKLFWILAALTMTIGNISALMQSHVKRMLAFSSVSHAGYLVLGVLVLNSVGLSAVLFYLVVYSAMNLGAFAILLLVEKDGKGLNFKDYRGFATQHPWMAVAMAVFMISLAGFPPTGGFIAKYGLLSSAVAEGYIWLVVIAVLNTLVSAYYYLRLIVNMYMQEEKDISNPVSGVLVLGLIGFLAVIVLILGITPEFLLNITTEAATTAF